MYLDCFQNKACTSSFSPLPVIKFLLKRFVIVVMLYVHEFYRKVYHILAETYLFKVIKQEMNILNASLSVFKANNKDIICFNKLNKTVKLFIFYCRLCLQVYADGDSNCWFCNNQSP